jgi:hypothetical protein
MSWLCCGFNNKTAAAAEHAAGPAACTIWQKRHDKLTTTNGMVIITLFHGLH